MAEDKLKKKRKKLFENNAVERTAKYAGIKSWRFVKFFVKKEAQLGRQMVGLVNRVDRKNEELGEKREVAVATGKHKFLIFRTLAEKNKVTLLKYGSVILVILIAVLCTITHFMAYQYSYNGKPLGIVKNQDDVLRVVDLVSQQMTKSYGAEVNIDKEKDISFKRVFSKKGQYDSSEDILNNIVYMQSLKVNAYAIIYDNKKLCTVDTKETAEGILQSLKDAYTAEHPAEYLDITFAENVDIVSVQTMVSRLDDPDEVIEKALTGGESVRYHSVESGETFSGIASDNGITQQELEDMNPDVNPDKLSIGQQLVLNEIVPLLTVQTLEIATFDEIIPYETVYEDSSSMYIGERRTKVAGVNGERETTAKVVKNNGHTMATLELSSVILSEPKTAVVYKGTKELPPLEGTGVFKYPVSGYRLTSKFGPRWGRMHYGIDLACKTGTDIRASDGGTVIFSGYSGSYGYVIKINHGGGFVTVYAHCSKLYVKKGEKVYQGQLIAAVGSTGRSTGPHCHFEIQKNGVAVNPLSYL